MKIKRVHPLFSSIITTAKRYVTDQKTKAGIILTDKMHGDILPWQTVVEVGSTVHDIKPGDVVFINFSRYVVAKHVPGKIEDNIETDTLTASLEIPQVVLNGEPHLRIQYADCEYFMKPGDYETDGGGLLQ